MKRWPVLIGLLLVLAACAAPASSPKPSYSPSPTVNPTAATTQTPAATATPAATQAATAAPTPTTAPTAAAAALSGFGATTAAWNASHRADPRFSAGTAFDPTPGLGPSEQYNDKYFGVLSLDGRVLSYSERLPKGSTFGDAKTAALAELPSDGKVLWTATQDTCAQIGLQSAQLGKALGGTGMLLAEVVTETAAGDSGYDPANANELLFTLGDWPTAADAPGC